MCGIAGFVGAELGDERQQAVLRAMTDSLIHRGPDGAGYHVEPGKGIGLGHRRLAIVDLTVEGKQPMVSASGRYVITFNGEVYNFERIRPELLARGHVFRGHSDTELMLAAFEEWGIEDSIPRFNGMFAFAVLDRHESRLVLARDRLGKKPLYYSRVGAALIFGSELKALMQFPQFPRELDRDAACLYLRHNYIPAPYTAFKGASKLEPGMLMSIEIRAGRLGEIHKRSYWSVADAYANGEKNRFRGTFSDAVQELDQLLRDSIALRMVADVPLGAFLSGGIDSSTIVALMQAQSSRPIKTFTIGFNEAGYSEAQHAEAVARHLGTEHTEFYLESEAALELIPKLPHFFDEPFSDSSQLPTMLVSDLARRHVTVSLSGDAGDELFCGYNRYMLWRTLWRGTHRGPAWIRRGAARAIRGVSAETWDTMLNPLLRFAPKSIRHQAVGDRLHKLSGVLMEDDPAKLYLRLITHWENPEEVVIGGREPRTVANSPSPVRDIDAYTERMMYLDTVTYLPDDIMTKVDRASMAVSLEARAPLMDYRILEFAASLPLSYKLEGSRGKRVLREVLYRYVPRELVDRPKTGFGVPIDSWLRGPLRDWAESLLSEERLKAHGVFRSDPVRKAWKEHLSGTFQRQYLLWDVLMYQAWLENMSSFGPAFSAGENAGTALQGSA